MLFSTQEDRRRQEVLAEPIVSSGLNEDQAQGYIITTETRLNSVAERREVTMMLTEHPTAC